MRHPEDDDRDLDQSELFAGWRAWLVRLADTAPVIWVIEDLQYADSGLLEFIDHVLDWTRTAPIHLVGLTRPELDGVRTGWATGRHHHPITLEPLDEASMARLLDALVPAMPAGAVAAIAEQAHGVPLFAVETVRSLIDDELVVPVDGRYRLVGDVGTLSVPETLRGVLTSRLDHLAAADRDLLATAGVLGTTFSAESLASVADRRIEDVLAALTGLVARDLVTVGADPLSPQRGSYSFTHDLLRRVAVDTLSRRDLRARHLRVADHLRSAFPDDGEEVADTIAQHLLDAVDAVPDHVDAARHRAEAVVELVRSGERASRLGAPRRAGLAWEAAAARTHDDAAAGELLVQAAHQLGLAGDVTDSMRCAEQARSRFDIVDDRHGAARASVQLGLELMDLQHYREARSILEPAVDLLRATPGVDALTGLRILCMIATFTASDDARDLATEAIRLAERVMPPPAELAKVFGTLGLMHSYAGERLRALAAYRESVRLAESIERWGDAAINLSNMAAEQVDFDPAAAMITATRGLDYARRAGFRIFVGAAAENLAQALISLGRWDEAAALLDEVDRVEGLGDAPFVVSVVGRLRGLRGDRAGAARCVDALEAVASEDAELHCYAAAISMFAMLGSVSMREELEAARAVLQFRDELGINFSSVREAWVVAARAVDRLGSDETVDILAMLDAHLPTELSPMLRAERLLVEARSAVDREQAFATAIAAERADSSPHLLAQGLLDWAEHRVRVGRSDDAALLIDEAAEIAERLGSVSISRRARGVRSSATTVLGPV